MFSVSTHAIHDRCLEVSLLKRENQQVRTFADKVITEYGVRGTGYAKAR
ncbi:hypothetical protein KG369_003184 [Salmonella enterica]|nr:hypothetical protein [Salmonella enterica]